MVTPNYVAVCATVLAGLIAMNIMFTFLHNPNNSKAFEDCVRLELNNGKAPKIYHSEFFID